MRCWGRLFHGNEDANHSSTKSQEEDLLHGTQKLQMKCADIIFVKTHLHNLIWLQPTSLSSFPITTYKKLPLQLVAVIHPIELPTHIISQNTIPCHQNALPHLPHLSTLSCVSKFTSASDFPKVFSSHYSPCTPTATFYITTMVLSIY